MARDVETRFSLFNGLGHTLQSGTNTHFVLRPRYGIGALRRIHGRRRDGNVISDADVRHDLFQVLVTFAGSMQPHEQRISVVGLVVHRHKEALPLGARRTARDQLLTSWRNGPVSLKLGMLVQKLNSIHRYMTVVRELQLRYADENLAESNELYGQLGERSTDSNGG